MSDQNEFEDNEEIAAVDESSEISEEEDIRELSPAQERELAEAMVFSESAEGEEAALLPEVSDEELDSEEEPVVSEAEFSGTELEAYESAEVEDVEFIETDRLQSIIESILFASDRPVSLASIRQVFKGTSVNKKQLEQAIENLMISYAENSRGVSLEEVTGGYQLRTKVDNMDFLKKTVKGRPFRLSGPALEVLAIAAYKQPLIKIEIDEIRGVESGHLLRALMEKGLVSFAGKSELPGKPMLYQTTRKFLEIFGLRNLKELPSLSEIDSLLPEGIGEEEDKPKLSDLTEGLSEGIVDSYSIGEEELTKISNQLGSIETSTDFFEQEKQRQKDKKDRERAQDIREALEMSEDVADKDRRWLERYEASLLEAQASAESKSIEAQTFTADDAFEAPPLTADDAFEAPPLNADDSVENMTAAADQFFEAHSSDDTQPVAEAEATEVEPSSMSQAAPANEEKNIVNEKLAKALAAFRQGFSEEPKPAAPKGDTKPPESEV